MQLHRDIAPPTQKQINKRVTFGCALCMIFGCDHASALPW